VCVVRQVLVLVMLSTSSGGRAPALSVP
jgi:hypothetical protein